MVSFDNTKSFVVKGFFIRKLGLRGFSMWQAAGDYNDELLNAIRDGVGFQNSLT
jgi:chitinase